MQATILDRPLREYDEREQRRLLDYEKNKAFEEKTDIAERLGYPLNTTVHYEMHGGAAYCLSDTIHRPFHDQTRQTMVTGEWKFTGENAFEAERLRLEHEESLMVDALGRGELSGNVLVKVSKVPDAVANGTASVDGYRRDLLRSFVRIYYRTGKDGISCYLFSLDGNSTAGFQRVENLVNMKLADRPSESVLADGSLFDWQSDDLATQVELLGEEVRLRYDEGVFGDTGRQTYAGSEYTDRANAFQVIEQHLDLFNEHYRAICDVAVRALSTRDRKHFLETMRKQTAAAIKLRSQGTYVESIGDGLVAAEAEAGEYGRECATTGMDQVQQAGSDKEITMTCPFCGLPTVGNPCAARLVCDRCSAEVASGRVVSKGIGRQAALRRLQQQSSAEEQTNVVALDTKKKKEAFARQFGANATVRTVVRVCDASETVTDKYTGEVYCDDMQASDLARAAHAA